VPRARNNLVGEFLGDYVYAVATRTYGAAVYNDTRNAADCPAIDAWRQSLRDGNDCGQAGTAAGLPGDVRQLRHLQLHDSAVAADELDGGRASAPHFHASTKMVAVFLQCRRGASRTGTDTRPRRARATRGRSTVRRWLGSQAHDAQTGEVDAERRARPG